MCDTDKGQSAVTPTAALEQLAQQYETEVRFRVVSMGGIMCDTRSPSERMYAMVREGSDLADRKEAVEYLKDRYDDALGKSDPERGRRLDRVLELERTSEVLRSYHGISDEEIGVSKTDRADLTQARQDAYAMRAIELYAEAHQAMSQLKDDTFGHYREESGLKLQGVQVALQRSGHNMGDPHTYQMLDADLTQKGFESEVQQYIPARDLSSGSPDSSPVLRQQAGMQMAPR